MHNRRKFIGALGALLCGGSTLSQTNWFAKTDITKTTGSFKYCLNTSTIRQQKLGLMANLEIASKAGYDGVELWLSDIYDYLNNGGTTSEIKTKLNKLNLTFENAMAFHQWIVDDENIRKSAMLDFEKDLGLLSKLGCKRIAAPPKGATTGNLLDLKEVAKRYDAILQVAESYGILPMLEVWGASVNLSRLSDAVFVLIRSKNENACMLPDIYHLHRGGSGFSGLKLLSKQAVPMFHVNDYPNIDISKLTDADRVFPGDGIAPISEIANDLKAINPDMVLSLELFSDEYWQMETLMVARKGLIKMKRVFH